MNVRLPSPSLLRDNVYAALRADILACHLTPGDELHEQELAERYAVSRSPVREALARLSRERLIAVQPRQGYRVAPVSLGDAEALLRFRGVLEPACAADAARVATDSQLAGLEPFRRFEGSAEDFIAYNRAFHAAVAEAGGNRRMAEAARDLIEQADRLVRISLANLKGRDPERLVAEHGAIVDALRARDGRLAARLLRRHLDEAEDRILTALRRHAVVA
ncbi:MAG TPA: GntR family transcriptional regulator [Stellaceae bacterium]|jgi:DNA-binding GntR family transcriptional regulator